MDKLLSYFSSFQSNQQNFTEVENGPGRVFDSGTVVANPVLVSSAHGLVDKNPVDSTARDSREKHPLHKKLILIACRLSGKTWKCKKYRESLQISSWLPGDQGQNNNTQATYENEFCLLIKGRLVQYKFL